MKKKSYIFYLSISLILIQLQGLHWFTEKFAEILYHSHLKKKSVTDNTFLNLIKVILFLKSWKSAIINPMDDSNPAETNQIWKPLHSIIFHFAP